ncbi:MAG: hypothetical protein SGPRY_002680, partial [Prymnesium sp.]
RKNDEAPLMDSARGGQCSRWRGRGKGGRERGLREAGASQESAHPHEAHPNRSHERAPARGRGRGRSVGGLPAGKAADRSQPTGRGGSILGDRIAAKGKGKCFSTPTSTGSASASQPTDNRRPLNLISQPATGLAQQGGRGRGIAHGRGTDVTIDGPPRCKGRGKGGVEAFSESVCYAGRSAQFVIAGDTFVPSSTYAHFPLLNEGDRISGRRIPGSGGNKRWRAISVEHVSPALTSGVSRQEAWIERSENLLAAIASESSGVLDEGVPTASPGDFAEPSLPSATPRVPCSPPSARSSSPSERCGEERRQAGALLEAGRLDECTVLCEQVLSAQGGREGEGGRGWALSMLGWIAYIRDDLLESRCLLRTARDALPPSSEERQLCCYRLARVLWRRGERDGWEEAVSLLSEASKASAEWAAPHTLIGILCLQLSQPARAEPSLRLALQINPTACEAGEALIGLLQSRGAGEASEEIDGTCTELAGHAPVSRSLWASVWLGYRALDQQAWGQAQRSFHAALRCAESHSTRPQGCGDHWKHRHKEWEDPHSFVHNEWRALGWEGLSVAYEAQGRMLSASRCLGQSLQLCKAEGKFQVVDGGLKYEPGVAATEATEALVVEGSEALAVDGSQALAVEEIEALALDASEVAARAVALCAANQTAPPCGLREAELCRRQSKLGSLQLELYQLQPAISNLCAALRIFPLHQPSLVWLAQAESHSPDEPATWLLKGEPAWRRGCSIQQPAYSTQACKPLRRRFSLCRADSICFSSPPPSLLPARLVLACPTDRSSWLQLAIASVEGRKEDTAGRQILRWLVCTQGEAGVQAAAWNALGVSSARREEHGLAQHSWIMAARLSPRSPTPWINYANLCLARGDVSLARQAFASAQQISAADHRGWLGQARCAELSLVNARQKSAALGSDAIQSMLRHSLEIKVTSDALVHLGAEAQLSGLKEVTYYCGVVLTEFLPDDWWGFSLSGLQLEDWSEPAIARAKLAHALALLERSEDFSVGKNGAVETALNLARLHVKLGEHAEACALLDRYAAVLATGRKEVVAEGALLRMMTDNGGVIRPSRQQGCEHLPKTHDVSLEECLSGLGLTTEVSG